jgi:hypothetical protein
MFFPELSSDQPLPAKYWSLDETRKPRKRAMSLEMVAEPGRMSGENLETLLSRRLGNRIRDLRVLVMPEGILLQGRTSTYHAKQLAQHAAMELADLPIVGNDIEVR